MNVARALAQQVASSPRHADYVDRLFRSGSVIRAFCEISDRLLRENQPPIHCDDLYRAFGIVSVDDTTGPNMSFVRDLILLKVLELTGDPALPEGEAETETVEEGQ